MTRDEIMKLEAGRELDALIAEHIFGYKWKHWDGDIVLVEPDELCRDANYVRTYWPNRFHRFTDARMDVPQYSTDIAAAWQVVEKLTELYHWKIRSPFEPDKPWFAGVTIIGVTGWNGTPDFDASAPSAPLAICRAALLAVMDNRP